VGESSSTQARTKDADPSSPTEGSDDDDPPNKLLAEPLLDWNPHPLPNPGIFRNVDYDVGFNDLLQ
jgi:hypothetical protein